MDFALRCNSLKCRSSLTEQAVVTTCSHIFCVRCSESLGLSNAANNERICPACETRLIEKDDAVVTQLHPPESYKTSILSGLAPSTIMECAGRGLAFYTYQATQEIVYQEYLTKSLTEKCTGVNMQLDQLIHDANSEISHLKNKLATFEIEHHSLMRKNHELIEAYNEKARSNARSQAAYDTLKKRLLQSSFESAAADAVEESLHFAGDEHSRVSLDDNVRSNVELLRQPGRTVGNVKNIYSHVREGSSSSNDGLHKFAPRLASVVQHRAASQVTSSQQRTRLPVATTQPSVSSGLHRSRPFHGSSNASQTMDTSTTRRPLASLSTNVRNDARSGEYGLSFTKKPERRIPGQESWGNSRYSR